MSKKGKKGNGIMNSFKYFYRLEFQNKPGESKQPKIFDFCIKKWS